MSFALQPPATIQVYKHFVDRLIMGGGGGCRTAREKQGCVSCSTQIPFPQPTSCVPKSYWLSLSAGQKRLQINKREMICTIPWLTFLCSILLHLSSNTLTFCFNNGQCLHSQTGQLRAISPPHTKPNPPKPTGIRACSWQEAGQKPNVFPA